MVRHGFRRLVLCSAAALPALVMAADPGAAQTFAFTGGNGFYGSDEHCPTPPQAVTTYRVSAETSWFGISGTYNDGDYPWPPEEDGFSAPRQEAMMSHGHALQLAAEIYPLGFTDSRIGTYFKPFIAVGVHKASDGDPEAGTAGNLDTFGVRGATDPLFGAGAKITLPLAGKLGIRAEARLNGILAGEFEVEQPGGAISRVTDDVQTWSELSFGFTYRLR